MIKKLKIFTLALLITAAIPFYGYKSACSLSAQDKKTETSQFASSNTDNQSNQDDQTLLKVALIILIIWTGIAFYIFQIERRLKKIEENLKD